MAQDYVIIRDPIHGFIKVSLLEREIINSRPFQRLRHIKQLAFTNYVYPGAEHTRFTHSLGVMEFATKIYDILTLKEKTIFKNDLGWNSDDKERNRQLLRLASLLHDTGHLPFSHASEDLLPDGRHHEDYTKLIIESEPIASIVDHIGREHGITSKSVAGFFNNDSINPTINFLKPILSGELDADRMDYLLRDSYYCGVHYGKFDHDRLINTFCLVEKPESDGNYVIAVEYGGLHALEAMVLARYFMFTQVYFHRVRRAYDFHLNDFLNAQNFKFPENIVDYLIWDDIRMMNFIRDKSNKDKNAFRIVDRNHFQFGS